MTRDYVPVEWITTRVDEVAAKCRQRKPDDNENFIYVDIGSIDRESKRIAEPQHLIGKDAPSRARKEISKGDVIVSLTRPNLNAVALVDEPYDGQIASTGFEVLKPVLIESKYLFALVRTRKFIDTISGKVQGALYPAAKAADVRDFEIPLPPLAEQKQIAARLDALLAQVDTLKARLDAIPAILKRFRQSVLAAAVSGRLTEEWRTNNKLSINDWDEVTFKDICSEITVGFVGKMADKYQETGIPFLRSQNIRAFQLSLKNILYIAEDFHNEISKSRLLGGDLAIVRSGAPGTTCVIPESLGTANCSDLVIARPNSRLNSEFGCIFMNSEVAQRNVAANQVGVAQQHFNVGSMKKMPVQLPSLEEQTEIVRRVEQLFAFADQIEQRVRDAQARVNQLTQSILAKAFRGELTAEWREQNPDLISGENSAQALLERIRAEQAKRKPRQRGRRKSTI